MKIAKLSASLGQQAILEPLFTDEDQPESQPKVKIRPRVFHADEETEPIPVTGYKQPQPSAFGKSYMTSNVEELRKQFNA